VPKTSLKIQLLNSKGETVARGITDRGGRHRFDGLLAGNYTLVAENPDRANSEERAETSLVIEEGDSLLYDLAVL
jgi:hypothetical protein